MARHDAGSDAGPGNDGSVSTLDAAPSSDASGPVTLADGGSDAKVDGSHDGADAAGGDAGDSDAGPVTAPERRRLFYQPGKSGVGVGYQGIVAIDPSAPSEPTLVYQEELSTSGTILEGTWNAETQGGVDLKTRYLFFAPKSGGLFKVSARLGDPLTVTQISSEAGVVSDVKVMTDWSDPDRTQLFYSVYVQEGNAPGEHRRRKTTVSATSTEAPEANEAIHLQDETWPLYDSEDGRLIGYLASGRCSSIINAPYCLDRRPLDFGDTLWRQATDFYGVLARTRVGDLILARDGNFDYGNDDVVLQRLDAVTGERTPLFRIEPGQRRNHSAVHGTSDGSSLYFWVRTPGIDDDPGYSGPRTAELYRVPLDAVGSGQAIKLDGGEDLSVGTTCLTENTVVYQVSAGTLRSASKTALDALSAHALTVKPGWTIDRLSCGRDTLAFNLSRLAGAVYEYASMIVGDNAEGPLNFPSSRWLTTSSDRYLRVDLAVPAIYSVDPVHGTQFKIGNLPDDLGQTAFFFAVVSRPTAQGGVLIDSHLPFFENDLLFLNMRTPNSLLRLTNDNMKNDAVPPGQ